MPMTKREEGVFGGGWYTLSVWHMLVIKYFQFFSSFLIIFWTVTCEIYNITSLRSCYKMQKEMEVK